MNQKLSLVNSPYFVQLGLTGYSDKYLPLFERLDQAMQERQHQESIRARALEVAKRKAQQQKNKRLYSDLLKN